MTDHTHHQHQHNDKAAVEAEALAAAEALAIAAAEESAASAETTEAASTEAEKKKVRQMTFAVLESGEIRADFGEGIEPLILNPALVPESIQAAAVTEGLISRTRGYTSKLTDKDRTPESLRVAVAKGFENLLAGIWKIERIGVTGAVEFSAEIEAAFVFRQMRAKAKNETFTGTMVEAAEAFSALSDEDKKTLKALPRYQLAFAEVKVRRQQEKTAALLAKIEKDENEEEGKF